MHDLLDDRLLSFARNSLALFPEKKNTHRMSKMAFYVQDRWQKIHDAKKPMCIFVRGDEKEKKVLPSMNYSKDIINVMVLLEKRKKRSNG